MSIDNQPPPALSLRKMAPVLVLATGLGGFFALGLDDYVSITALRENRELLGAFVDHSRVLAALIFVVTYAVVVSFSLPGGAVMTMTGGFLFGVGPGGGLAVIGATIGATALFLVAKTSVGDALEARAGPAIKKMEAGFRKNAFSYLIFLRLVPLFPFFLVNLVPAFLGVGLRTYFLTTLLGIIPGSFVYASVGNGMSAILEHGGSPNFQRMSEPDVLIPLIGLAALALVPIVYKRLRRPTPETTPETIPETTPGDH